MGTTLTGTTPQDTYDSLIKVTDNGPLSGSLKVLTDGLGNNSTLSLSTAAASIAGTLAVTGDATFSGTTAVSSAGGTSQMRIDRSSGVARLQNYDNGSAANISLQHDGGNVGIGTSAPASPLEVVLPARTNEDTSAQHAIFGSGTSGNGIRIGYNSANNIGFVSALKPASAWSDLELEGGSIRFAPTGTERVRVTSDGLTFNGDTAAANALDDYEEGTWTMGVSFGGASVGVTTSANTGTYTKIGRKVTVNGYLLLSSKGSSTGVAKITGLPFTIPNSATNYSAASLFFINISFTNQFQSFGEISTTGFVLEQITLLGATSAINDTNFANNSGIILSFTYFV